MVYLTITHPLQIFLPSWNTFSNGYTMTIKKINLIFFSQEMTVSWCMKRAELILKCVKGNDKPLACKSEQKIWNIIT